MNNQKGSILPILIITLLAVVIGYFILGKDNSQNLLTQIKQVVKKEETGGKTESQPIDSAQVSILKEGFTPQTITIAKNQQVTWINQDENPHQVASDPHPIHDGLAGFDSEEPLAKGDSFSFIFEEVGTYTYHDHLNPSTIKGIVIVK
jgi:plastocyanin